MEYSRALMAWSVEHTDEFAEWYAGLSESQQDDLTAVGLLLMKQGPQLPFPRGIGKGQLRALLHQQQPNSGQVVLLRLAQTRVPLREFVRVFDAPGHQGSIIFHQWNNCNTID